VLPELDRVLAAGRPKIGRHNPQSFEAEARAACVECVAGGGEESLRVMSDVVRVE
jgi:hypothetical protein